MCIRDSFNAGQLPYLRRTRAGSRQNSPHRAGHRPVTGLESRDQFRRGIIDYENGIATAELFAGTGSHLISQAMSANALIRIPAGAQLQPGDVVEVIPF